MVRAIAVIQILWTTVQLIVRGARHLAVSQLEVAVAAFAVCAIITYVLNWDKPKGVRFPFTLIQYSDSGPEELRKILDEPQDIYVNWLLLITEMSDDRKIKPGAPPGNGHTLGSGSGMNFWGIMMASTIFGGVHLTAWHLVFPTDIEQTLWRASSLLCTTALLGPMLLSLLIAALLPGQKDKAVSGVNIVIGFLIISCNIGYIVARVYMMVEVFRCLCFLPPDTYASTWATNIPHIA